MKTLKLFLLALLVSFSFSSCDKEDDPSLNEGIDDSYFVEVEMNGKLLILPEGKDGYRSVATTGLQAVGSRCIKISNMLLAKETTLENSMQVSIQKIVDTCPVNNTSVEDLYQVGEYPFAKKEETQEADGVVILYTDIAGTEWSTNRGSQDQTGSHFEIVAHRSIESKDYKYETEAVFNCKLYNDKGGEMVLTNGRINSRSVRK
jgi:hypothetical protein